MTAEPVALTAELFARHLGQAFRVDGGPHVLTLTKVEASPKEDWQTRAPFLLLFSGPPADVVAEGMRTIALDDGTAYDLYLIPVHTPAPGRQDYQAVFN